MAGDFDLSARITADASGLVAAATQAETAYEGLDKAQRDVAAGARELEAASGAATKAQEDKTRSERGATAAHEDSARATRGATTETLAQVIARERAAKASIDTAAAEARLAAAQSVAERSAAAAALAAIKLQQAQERQGQSTSALDRDLASLRAQLDPTGEAERRLAAATDLANTALARGIITQEQYEGHLRSLNAAGNGVVGGLNRQGYAIRNVGQQFGDFGLQVAGGADVARAFGQQAGQLGFALSELESGPLKAVGTFLTGPWGIALTIAAAFVAPLIGKLFEADKAADATADGLDKAAGAADSFGNASSNLGKIIDVTTGKLKTHNAVLIQTVRLQAQVAQQEADKKLKDFQASTQPGASRGAIAGGLVTAFRVQAGLGTGDDRGDLNNLRLSRAQTTLLGRLNSSLATTLNDDTLARGNPEEYSKRVGAAIDSAIARVDALAYRGRLAGKSVAEVKAQLLGLGAAAQDKAANRLVENAANGGKVSDLLVPYSKPKKPPKPKSTEARDEFGRDAADKIANIVGQFDDAPAVIDKTNAKIRELDDLIEDLGRRKPKGFDDLIAQAEAAKTVVRDGLIKEVAKAFEAPKTLADKGADAIRQLDAVIADLNANQPKGFDKLISSAQRAENVIRDSLQKPYRDFIKDQQESLELQRLTLTGRVDEANALKQINALEKQGPPLTAEQKVAVLATVQALRAEQVELERLRQLSVKYTEALGGIKTVVEDATQAFVRGDLGQLLKSPGKLLDAFQTLNGRKLFDKLFAGAFTDLQDQIDGTSPVKAASKKMADAVAAAAKSIDTGRGASDRLAPSLDTATASTVAFTTALDRATGRLNDGPTVTPVGGSGDNPADGGSPVDANGDIVVTARKRRSVDAINGDLRAGLQSAAALLPEIKGILKGNIPQDKSSQQFFADALGKVGTQVAGVFTNPDKAKVIGSAIGTFAGKGLAGAATGSLVSGIAGAVGVKLNKTGSQIGGAIGSFIPIPGGEIIGSIAGGLIGNLVAGKPKAGGATVTGSGGAFATTSTGSDKGGIATGTGLAGSITQGIQQIAQQLGGTLGAFNVSIGSYKGDLRVNENGKALGGVKNSGAYGFGDDQEAAVAKAIQLAVGQGAVQGLSAAVQRALSSSSDVDKALQEALGVKALEQTLGGLGGQLKAIFDAENAAGKERVRLAQAYGLDITATEKLNDESRAKLVDDTLKSRIGSLSDFLQSVKFGDLFEGTAADRRAALLKEIATAQTDAEAGKDGAADRLAQLRSQLVTTSRDAFGTAGPEYAADRANSISGVERVIQMETDRVNAAAGITQATTDAVNKVASGVDETNDLVARQTAAILALPDQLASLLGTTGGSGVKYASTQRYANLELT